MSEEKKQLKPGAYICIVEGENFAFFNKRIYGYGDRVVIESQELVDKLGNRFIPEEDFRKKDADLIHKIRSASSNNKTVEDIIRSTEAEKKEMKVKYEAEIAKLKADIANVKPAERIATEKK